VDLGGEIRKEMTKPEFGGKFVPIATIMRIFYSNNSRELRRSLGKDLNKIDSGNQSTEEAIAKLESYVKSKAVKLYAVLLLIGAPELIVELSQTMIKSDDDTDQTIGDWIFGQSDERTDLGSYCTLEYLESSPLKHVAPSFYDAQWRIPPVLHAEIHRNYPPRDFHFPFEYKSKVPKGGSNGSLLEVKVADGHLKAPGYKTVCAPLPLPCDLSPYALG